MLLEVAGKRTVPPYEPLAYRAAEACGRLPLVLAVAGGILAEAGGRLSEEYLALLVLSESGRRDLLFTGWNRTVQFMERRSKCLERVPKYLEAFQHVSVAFQSFPVAFQKGSAELT